VYTSDVPVDVDAAVIANRRLSEDYCVLSLAAPEIARLAQPGQFVMVKTSGATDPLLRRPFSIFEILRDGTGALTGITILNKQIGSGTRLLYAAAPGMRLACLGPLGRPFEPVTPPAEAWMIAGGVGLAPFATLATALLAAGTITTLFYGARRASDLHCIEQFEHLGMRVVVTTEDGSRGIKGYVTAALDAELAARSRSDYVKLYACGPTPMMRAVARLADTHDRDCDVSLEQVMGCGLGGCYSCVVPAGRPGDAPHLVRSCLEGPVFDARCLVWDALAH
jgi:dihydroorotate dehydrogenase electron transfer subunit